MQFEVPAAHLWFVTVSMRVMSAGDGYRYLLKSVAAGDGDRALSTPLTRYYAEIGTPPGLWLGTGIGGLAGGALAVGDQVSEEQLERLLGRGCDPVTGNALGRAFQVSRSVEERIARRIRTLGADLSAEERDAAVAAIETEENQRGRRRAVAGYDYTFSVPKSVSALWAIADPDTQAAIVHAHHAAVADTVAFTEREVAATRAGINAHDGAVAQVDVNGLVAIAFDHYDSRTGDPQLHTHVVISNKVQTVFDGRWRALDGRPMHAATVALSEHYNALLADRLTQTLGVGWEQRTRGPDRNPAWEIADVPGELVHAFSSRARAIEVEKDRLIADYVAAHGHQPSTKTIIRLRAQATLTTRPNKTVRSLADLTGAWRDRAGTILGVEPTQWAHGLLEKTKSAARSPVVRADQIAPSDIAELAAQVVQAVGEKRATWRRWNLHAEASRQTMGIRFATTVDREMLIARVTDAAQHACVRLSPPELAVTPAQFRRADGTSAFRPKHSPLYTSQEVLAAEGRLLSLANLESAPRVPGDLVRAVARHGPRRRLGVDQQAAVAAVAASGRVLDVLVGPAGAGKTTALNALRRAWETSHGKGSIVGLAPSAAAADVLATELAISTDNTAKWAHEHTHGRWNLQPGHLVILDEASLADTRTLDLLATHAEQVGAKMLLVGDPAQLDAVDAGGAFGLVVRNRTDVPELTDVRRFNNDWEGSATLALRRGDTDAIATYQHYDRIVDGDTDQMLNAAYTAWKRDTDSGKTSLMIVDTHDIATELNSRARADRILASHVTAGKEIELHDGTNASAGDLVVTRRNNRRLTAGRGWVKNGDRWTVTAAHTDGSLTLRREGRCVGATVRLPADYVAEHLELAYATSVHRAQGATVDTAHTIVATPSTTREAFYVAMTRGREANTAYVGTDQSHAEEHQRQPDSDVTAASILHGVLNHVGAELSAYETLAAEHERWATIAQLAAEYETIAATAQADRWTALLQRAGLSRDHLDEVVGSDAYGPLTAQLRHAEATGHDLETLVTRLVTAHGFDDADDIAAVLHHRIQTATARPTEVGRRGQPRARLIAGLIPEATGAMPDDMRHALDERQQLIEQRAQALAETALRDRARWLQQLGTPPIDVYRRQQWIHSTQVVAAYRDRYQITTDCALGPSPDSAEQRRDAARARAAMHDAVQIGQAESVAPLRRSAVRMTPPTR